MANRQFRKVCLINADALSAAKQQIAANLSPENSQKSAVELAAIENQLSCIDMTKDFNQNKWLGQELAATLIYFDSQTRPNALLSVFSCVRGGATIFLAYNATLLSGYFKTQILLPQLQAIADKTHLAANLMTSLAANLSTNAVNSFNSLQSFSEPLKLSSSQAQSLIRIKQAIENKQSVIHLIGARGTGKSTLLGVLMNDLAAKSEQNSKINIALISQYKTSSNSTFNHLSDVSRETISYYAPSEFRQHQHKYHIILIDEAATLPKQFIQTVINEANEQRKTVVLATTLAGYEGTGQSYRLNYTQTDKENICVLRETLRFPPNDPLHQLSQQLCHPQIPIIAENHSDGMKIFSTQSLRAAGLTESCFALLQQAHYKTTPNDLERFYDAPAVFVLAFSQGKLVAACYVVSEQLPLALQDKANLQAIVDGKRRVKDALTQQSLLYAYGENQDLAATRILRISRIATIKSEQRKGFAAGLIKQLAAYAKQQHYNALSTSFTLTKSTWDFWSALDFMPVRLGTNKNKWQGEYALLMFYELAANQRLTAILSKAYYRHILYYQKTYSASNSGKLLYKRVTVTKKQPLSLTELQRQISSVLDGHRDIHWLLPILAEFTKYHEITTVDSWFSGKLIDKQDLPRLKSDLNSLRPLQ